MATPITGQSALDWLQRSGIDITLARKVIIAISADDAVKVYIERYADKAMFDVAFDGLGDSLIVEAKDVEQ